VNRLWEVPEPGVKTAFVRLVASLSQIKCATVPSFARFPVFFRFNNLEGGDGMGSFCQFQRG
jgi:hypothetical protein